ncbi:hypothetical protein [Comamonas terrae]|uniref:hypothetical protein n=1 Tax=Comamonas terrae TaxID=673548 RepID=UPI000A6F5902|nr:hypothetical protein [Comamonas terrae]
MPTVSALLQSGNVGWKQLGFRRWRRTYPSLFIEFLEIHCKRRTLSRERQALNLLTDGIAADAWLGLPCIVAMAAPPIQLWSLASVILERQALP